MNDRIAPDVCIYHGGCDDGFTAAWVVNKKWPGVDLFPGVYQQPPPNVRGLNVTIVDFSYDAETMSQLAATANSVTVLDHHDTARQALEPLLKDGIIRGQFDMARCGAMMAWDWCFPGEQPPPMLQYIQDNDLGRYALPRTREVKMGVRSYLKTLDVWDIVMQSAPTAIADEGMSIQRYMANTVIPDAVGRARLALMRGGYTAMLTNTPFFAASDVAGQLAKDHPEANFAACFWAGSDGLWTFSLRSHGSDEEAFHVGEYARDYFGGGGHRRAAGFRVPAVEQAAT